MESSHLLERSALEGTYKMPSVAWAQLEPGPFEVRYGVVNAELVELSVRHMSTGFTIEADVAPHKFMLGLLANPRTQARWFGTAVDGSHIGVSATSIALSTAGASSFYQLTIDEETLLRLYPKAADVLALIEKVQSVNLARDPINARRLRAHMECLFSADQKARGASVRPPLRNIYGTLIPLLASAIEGLDSHLLERSKCLNRRLAAVRKCEAFMREHVDATVTLLDLSQVSGMRSRSLINAFEATTGFSPMDYLKRLRLNGVHRALQRANKMRTRIIDVATDWGFWHMGHFTTEYRAMFGETPSQTLLAH